MSSNVVTIVFSISVVVSGVLIVTLHTFNNEYLSLNDLIWQISITGSVD